MNDVLEKLKEQLRPKPVIDYLVDTCHSLAAVTDSIYERMRQGWQPIGRRDMFFDEDERVYWKVIYRKEVWG